MKRVIYTSPAGTVTINKPNGTGVMMDENNWSDVEFLTSVKPLTWVYISLNFLSFFNNVKIDLLICIICRVMLSPKC